ncbi:uncharacterized protein BXZ73DRAFT_38262 [Epithele typhae]|uniref:uncharacterized protein n=1 Tax=Epithele typhae TaxID=378194 RepID=UPI002008E07C|nr:uncharacterized protein BXZ73DRAFT_38262 [Epithele typhae]KAH9945423.1 hypothetical protein BXZ73DRAFT_38262 [Epithele typhae]
MTTLFLPPPSLLPSAAASQLDVSNALPTYTRTTENDWDVPDPTQEHQFFLTLKKTGVRWLTLSLQSRATSADNTPVFYQTGEIKGTVTMELDKEELMDDVTLSLYGRLTVYTRTATMPSNFLFMTRKLYSAVEDTTVPSIKRGRLRGTYKWPFSFHLPKGVNILMSSAVLGVDGEKERYRLPPTFSDEDAGVNIEYMLSFRANRGGFKPSSKLVVPFNYVPLARPGPASILQQLAYQQNVPLVGPSGDPDAWRTLDPVTLEGTLFKTIAVSACFTLSLTKPLMYTRGAPLHIHLTVCSANEQFLDLLSLDSLHVALVQELHFGDNVAFWPRFSQRLAPQHFVKPYERARATWWHDTLKMSATTLTVASSVSAQQPPAFSEVDARNTRSFMGEMQVPGGLAPACEILHYSHKYHVALYPPDAVGFVPSTPRKKALVEEEVGIVTSFAQGPKPCSYLSPQYDAPED